MLRTLEDQMAFQALRKDIMILNFRSEILEIETLDLIHNELIRLGNQIIMDFENWIQEPQQLLEEVGLDHAIDGFLRCLETTEFDSEEVKIHAVGIARDIREGIFKRWKPIRDGNPLLNPSLFPPRDQRKRKPRRTRWGTI